MYKTALVDEQIEDAKRLMKALEKTGLRVRVAFWFFDREIEDWRLVLHFPQVDDFAQSLAYGFVHRAMLSIHPRLSLRLEDIMLQSSQSPLIAAIRTVVNTSPDELSGIIIGPQAAGKFWIEEAYIYRLS